MGAILSVQPIPYQGSKRKLASIILNFFPKKCNGKLIEPFAGSAAISLACVNRGIFGSFLINDSYEPLIALWNMILSNPEECIRKYSSLWNQQLYNPTEYYYDVREKFNSDKDPIKFLYLMSRCAKNAIRFNSNGEFNQSPDKRRLGRKPEIMKTHILKTNQLLRGKTLTSCLDYSEVLEMATPNDLVYMDPPYQGTSTTKNPRYHQGLDFDRFVCILEILNRRNIPYIISFDGKLGDKQYGKSLPKHLELRRISLDAGTSAQSTLIGKKEKTTESLYLSQRAIEMT